MGFFGDAWKIRVLSVGDVVLACELSEEVKTVRTICVIYFIKISSFWIRWDEELALINKRPVTEVKSSKYLLELAQEAVAHRGPVLHLKLAAELGIV